MLIYALVGAATGSGIGYLIFDSDGVLGGGLIGGGVAWLAGAILHAGAAADRREAEAQAGKKKAGLEEDAEQRSRAKRRTRRAG